MTASHMRTPRTVSVAADQQLREATGAARNASASQRALAHRLSAVPVHRLEYGLLAATAVLITGSAFFFFYFDVPFSAKPISQYTCAIKQPMAIRPSATLR